MTNIEVYELLRKIDSGYVATEYERRYLASVKKLSWSHVDSLPECMGMLESLTYLDLSWIDKTTDIDSLVELTSLICLNLLHTQVNDIGALSRLTCLESFSLIDSQVNDIGSLSKMKRLTNLSIINAKVSDISALAGVTGLKNLCIVHTKISDISALSGMTEMKTLDLSGNEDLTDISALSGMTNLENLNLSGTKVSDIAALSGLSSMKTLNLSLNSDLIDIYALSGLTSLVSLDLSLNSNLKDISVLSVLTGIQNLDVSGTDINDISSLSGLKCLTNLRLSFTDVSDISVLNSLKGLNSLALQGSNVNDISSLSGLNNLKIIDLRNLTISSIPQSIIDIGLDFIADEYPEKPGIFINGLILNDQPIINDVKPQNLILNNYRATKSESIAPVNKCKVVFLGDGGAGKSLIIDRLIHDGNISDDFDGESTPGIHISSKTYLIENEEIELHFWDFGGQEIMHSMHRMFLTNRTLYVVVTNARDNKANEQAWYWIRNIKSFANGAPVFLIVNQKDQNPSANVNMNGLRNEYPALKEVRFISALKDTRESFIFDIEDTIRRIVSEMEIVHTFVPKKWLALSNYLKEMAEDYISSDKFYEVCDKYNVETNNTIRDELINWYQDLGVCFYSKSHPVSKSYVVLKPRWLLNALYILIFNGRNYAMNGIIKESDIYELFCRKGPDKNIMQVYSEITYKEEEIQYILTVLLNYELIYRLDEERIFIPMLCDENEPKSLGSFVSEDVLHISFEYTYLPENVLHKLMVRHGYDLNTKVVWRAGAMFYNKRCWFALVRMKDNCLDIFARTSQPETHPVNVYLDILRESIHKINEEFGLKAVEYIFYHKDDMYDRFEYEVLKGTLELGINKMYSKVFGSVINIEEILVVVSSQDRLSGQGTDSRINRLLNALSAVLLKLQVNSDYYYASEYSCSTYVRDMLEQYGYVCFDQALTNGDKIDKEPGLYGLLIRERNDWRDLSIYEAIKMKDFGKMYQHILYKRIQYMLDSYNSRGLRNFILVSFVSWDKDIFNRRSEQYIRFVSSGKSFPFTVVESKRLDFLSDMFMRCHRVGYDYGGIIMYMYHIIVRVAEK